MESVVSCNGNEVHLCRRVILFPKLDGLPILLDGFDVVGGSIHDYILRVNDLDFVFESPLCDWHPGNDLYGHVAKSPRGVRRT